MPGTGSAGAVAVRIARGEGDLPKSGSAEDHYRARGDGVFWAAEQIPARGEIGDVVGIDEETRAIVEHGKGH